MATKTMPLAASSGHTAGIFADMSVDGPTIGTLVIIIDRAKNLPNRKTIGKQDPYCAARLGKEAKKTGTDVRGGQTPKWDQELRFTVHDSSDYYQLKVSVFTDDRRTDLIGEAWIDLKSIIVPGGGQKDVWQTLLCRGKYAGEVRIELTYYDDRKPDMSSVRHKNSTASDQETGSLKQKGQPKRRPLPLDPVTGEAPSSPASAPPAPQVTTTPEYHHQTPPRPHSFVPTQSPLQSVEYSPSGARPYVDQYSPQPQPGHSLPRLDGARPSPRFRDAHDAIPRHYEGAASHYDSPTTRYEPSPLAEHRHSATPSEEGLAQPQFVQDECPPPPPAHRSIPPTDGQDLMRRSVYDSPPQMGTPTTPMRHGVLMSEAHRYSSPSYPGRPIFRPYEPQSAGSSPTSSHGGSPVPPSRHSSYNPVGDPRPRSMQPTVEDVPEFSRMGHEPPHKHGASRPPSNEELMFAPVPRSESMDLVRSRPASSHYASQSTAPAPGRLPTSSSLVHVRDHSGTLNYHAANRRSHRPSPRPDFDTNYTPASRQPSMPDVPVSLSPGMDSGLSQDTLEHIYQDRHPDSRYPAPMALTDSMQGRPHHPGDVLHALQPPSPTYAVRPHDGWSGASYSRGQDEEASWRGEVPSPSYGPQHRIPRKSLSPAPLAGEEQTTSEIPFGPDSYDSLNPVRGSPREANPKTERPMTNSKIITHDGREVDPSDHLPMESWAPEPEPKPGQAQSPAEPRGRPTPAGAQPMPPSGRRPLRYSLAQASPTSPLPHDVDGSPRTPPTSGRNRLQKRAGRASGGAPGSMSSPLAPVSPDNFQERQVGFPRSGGGEGRRQSWDYPNENHVTQHYASPPIPAKVPMMAGGGGHTGAELALMHEMQRIDIGAGRSRRRGGY